MELSKTLFWDTDIGKIDYDRNSRQIIERVLQRGILNDHNQNVIIENIYSLL